MRKALTVLSILVLSTFVTIGRGQQDGDSRNNFSGNLVGEFYHVRVDTNFILYEDFDTGSLGDWTEIGGVDLIIKSVGTTTDSMLEVRVVGGGTDNIYQTIVSCSEYWYRLRVNISDADTSGGWTNGEVLYLAEIKQSGTNNGRGMFGIIHSGGTLKWMVSYTDDAGSSTSSNGTTEVDTDTWYTLLWHVKKATAVGADNGISNLKVDGVEEIAITDWDNPAVTYNHISAGYWSNPFNAIYYIDDVVFWSNEGLP